jgi:tetratricopeptide (TPR) repeat protein
MSTRTNMLRLAATASVLVVSTATSAVAQGDARARADSLVEIGNVAAHDSRHREAIEIYERAIALDSARRTSLLPRLGRQYLWSDEPRQAARLFTEYLTANPTSCETKLDLGLAWSWADELQNARATYDDVAASCLYERGQARLGAARALRWGNKPTAAERRYHQVMADGSDTDREQAAIGLAYVYLARAEPRRALALADSLERAGSRDASLAEAKAMALADLGALGTAVATARAARADGRGSASLDRLADGYRERARASFSAGARGFRDRDGTNYRAADVASAAAPLGFGAMRVAARATELRKDGVSLESREAEASFDSRLARWMAVSARGGMRAYEATDFNPWEGELNVALLPGDRHRVDVTAARIMLGDNVAAIQQELVGTFASVGITERFTPNFSVAVSGDVTDWSTDNRRTRARVTPRMSFEVLPAVTLEWPTAYQRYDEPFAFQLFSPREYVETGPALNVYRRVAQAWYVSAYGKAGGLRESGRDWQALGIARASVERDIRSHWGIRFDAGWSNSNLAGSAGFQRTTAAVSLTIRP